MRSAPPTVEGAAIASAVGLAAMLLLSESEAVGLPVAEVEDETDQAVAAYRARYRRPPKSLVVSLAGSTFSSDPSVSPRVQKTGDTIYAEASVGGVRLTWLGVAHGQQHKAALRVQRFARNDAPCSTMKLALDGRERVVPAKSKSERASVAFKQTVQAELDLRTIDEVASAKHVVVDVCGTAREFSSLARKATGNFALAYRALAAALPPPVALAAGAAPTTEASATTPDGAAAAAVAAPVSAPTNPPTAPVAADARDVR
jgi:hypothetical protein